MCSCHDTLPSSTLQNQGIFSSFIIYVILVLFAFFFFLLSRLTTATDCRQDFLSYRHRNYNYSKVISPSSLWWVWRIFYYQYFFFFFSMIHLLFPS